VIVLGLGWWAQASAELTWLEGSWSKEADITSIKKDIGEIKRILKK